MDRSFPRTVERFFSAADDLNIALPSATRAELQQYGDLVERGSALTFSRRALANAVTDALRAGVDVTTDPRVQAALVGVQLSALHIEVDVIELATAHLGTTVSAAVDDLVAAFQPSYTAASTALRDAHATLRGYGITGLAEVDLISRGNLDVARANLAAREATATLGRIWQAVGPLLLGVNRLDQSPAARVLGTVDVGEAGTSEVVSYRRLTPWEALTEGYTPSLATPTETVQRVARAAKRQQELDSELDAAARVDRGSYVVSGPRA